MTNSVMIDEIWWRYDSFRDEFILYTPPYGAQMIVEDLTIEFLLSKRVIWREDIGDRGRKLIVTDEQVAELKRIRDL